MFQQHIAFLRELDVISVLDTENEKVYYRMEAI